MVEYSQKWHNGTSRGRSTKTSKGLAAIQAQLNNLRREIKKVKEKVYAAQVGCEQCKGPHYTKDCLLKEEGKTLEEAYYTQFGGPFQGGGYRATALGYYQRNNANPSFQERRQSMEDTLSKFMILTLWSLLLGPGAVPTDTTLSNRCVGLYGTTTIHTSETPSNHHRGLLQSRPISAADNPQHHPLPPPSLLLQLHHLHTSSPPMQRVLAAIRVRLVSSAEGALGLVLNPFKDAFGLFVSQQGLRLVIKTAARAAFG
ncbi:hypothetical protein Tco_1539017 [Tanacetum coccineum]